MQEEKLVPKLIGCSNSISKILPRYSSSGIYLTDHKNNNQDNLETINELI